MMTAILVAIFSFIRPVSVIQGGSLTATGSTVRHYTFSCTQALWWVGKWAGPLVSEMGLGLGLSLSDSDIDSDIDVHVGLSCSESAKCRHA